METKKEFEELERAMINALNAGVISIEHISIGGDGNTELWLDFEYPCLNLIFDMYQKK
jgi:hypothetical protein